MKRYQMALEFSYVAPEEGTDGGALLDFFVGYLQKHPRLKVTMAVVRGEESLTTCGEREPMAGADICNLLRGHEGLHSSGDALWRTE